MRSIGIFDSGVGGLTVARAIADQFPAARLVYLGDTARVPYGSKSPETVLRYAIQVSQFLSTQNIDLLVIACNTATAAGLHELRARYDFPVIGVIEPGIQRTLQLWRGGTIGVIGTRATIQSDRYAQGIRTRAASARVVQIATPLLVPLVEEGWAGNSVTRQILDSYLQPLGDVDTLVLGCTHYPLLREDIQQQLPRTRLVDSAQATAAAIADICGTCVHPRPGIELFMTDTSDGFVRIASQFFGRQLDPPEHIDL